MTGALLGLAVSVGLCGWLVRDVFKGLAALFAWKPWLQRVVPVTFGAGTVQLFTTADVIYVHRFFPDAEQLYTGGDGGPGADGVRDADRPGDVPKVARSAAVAGKSHAMMLALVTTGAGAAAGALACTVFLNCPSGWFTSASPSSGRQLRWCRGSPGPCCR
jgi:hypothetical protein